MAKKNVIDEELFVDVLDDVAHIEQLKAALQEKIASRKSEIVNQLKLVINTFGLTSADLFNKEELTTAVEAVQANAVPKVKQVRPVFYNPQAIEGEKICRDRGKTFPKWYTDFSEEQRAAHKVTDHKKAHELLVKYSDAKSAQAYFDCFLKETEPNPAP